MKCNHCNNEIPNDSAFCPFCGNRVTPAVPEPAPVFTPPTEVPFAPPAEPVAAPVYTDPAYVPPAPEEQPKKKTNLIPFIAIGAVAVIAAVAILLVILFAGGKSPQDAAQNLIDSGNFTVVAKVVGQKYTLQVNLDFKKQDATVYAESNGEFAFAIYDGYYLQKKYDYWSGEYRVVATDISEEMEAFFESYEKADQSDWDEIASMLEDMMDEDVEDYINIKKFEKAMDTFEKNMENKRWLKKYAGYSTEREDGVKLHIYEPDLTKFANAVLDIFKDCFEDDDLYDTAVDALDEYEDVLDDMEITLTLGVKGKYLVNAEAEVQGIKVKVTFDKIGKTKINTKDLKNMLDEALDD